MRKRILTISLAFVLLFAKNGLSVRAEGDEEALQESPPAEEDEESMQESVPSESKEELDGQIEETISPEEEEAAEENIDKTGEGQDENSVIEDENKDSEAVEQAFLGGQPLLAGISGGETSDGDGNAVISWTTTDAESTVDNCYEWDAERRCYRLSRQNITTDKPGQVSIEITNNMGKAINYSIECADHVDESGTITHESKGENSGSVEDGKTVSINMGSIALDGLGDDLQEGDVIPLSTYTVIIS